jgi:hypothetical protein
MPRIITSPSPKYSAQRGKTRMIDERCVVTPMKYIVGRSAAG